VLNTTSVSPNQISGFEVAVSAINDDGTINTRYADIAKVGNIIVECKSWEIGGRSFSYFVQGEGSYGQFRTYLSETTTLTGLEYWFDKEKKDVTDEAVKRKFQQMFNAKLPEVWDIIETKPAIRSAIGSPADEEAFQREVNNLSSKLYSFIKLK
jgi:hypothetical protein